MEPLSAEQTPEQIAAALEAFLAEHPKAVVMEDGKVLFDMRAAKYSLATEHGRCTLQLWSEERNIVRRVSAAAVRGAARDRLLRLTTQRFGQAQAGSLELLADRDRRTPSTREATRVRYLRALERVMLRGGRTRCVGRLEGGRLPHRDGPGEELRPGLRARLAGAWAAGVGGDRGERGGDAGDRRWDPDAGGAVAGALPRERAAGAGFIVGCGVIVPKGMATLTASRLAWMNSDAAQWELWEFDEKTRRDGAAGRRRPRQLADAADPCSE